MIERNERRGSRGREQKERVAMMRG